MRIGNYGGQYAAATSVSAMQLTEISYRLIYRYADVFFSEMKKSTSEH